MEHNTNSLVERISVLLLVTSPSLKGGACASSTSCASYASCASCTSLFNAGAHHGAVNCCEPERNERNEMMADRVVASLPPSRLFQNQET